MQAEETTMGEMINSYYNSLKPPKPTKSNSSKKLLTNKEVIRFGKWYGFEHKIADISPILVEEYSNKILANNLATNVNSVQELRKFIRFINPKLTTGLRLKRKQKLGNSGINLISDNEISTLTKAGYKSKSQELEKLKNGRLEIAEQIKIAAADKDVRENAALEAARESLGKLEAQIKELETILSKSQVVSEKTVKNRVSIGSQVLIQETSTKKSSTFTIVAPIEASPLEMRISSKSPVGNSLLKHKPGDIVDVKTPGGMVTYKIKKVF
jgi:transcription elongation factor GreA